MRRARTRPSGPTRRSPGAPRSSRLSGARYRAREPPAAFRLSGAAGLNAWLPLFLSALLARLDIVELAAPFDDLTSTPALVVLGGLTVADFVGDKIPVVDHVLLSPARSSHRRPARFSSPARRGSRPTCRLWGLILLGGTTAGSIHAARGRPPCVDGDHGRAQQPRPPGAARRGLAPARRHGVRVAAPRARPRRLAARRAPRVVATAPRRPPRRPTRVARCYPAALHAAALHPGRSARLLVSLCVVTPAEAPSPTARSTCTSSTSRRSRSSGPPTGRSRAPTARAGGGCTWASTSASSSLDVRAATGGIVTASGWLTGYEGYGNVVTLDVGGGYTLLYAHLSQSHVVPGQWVEVGESIGLAGCNLHEHASPLRAARAQRADRPGAFLRLIPPEGGRQPQRSRPTLRAPP